MQRRAAVPLYESKINKRNMLQHENDTLKIKKIEDLSDENQEKAN